MEMRGFCLGPNWARKLKSSQEFPSSEHSQKKGRPFEKVKNKSCLIGLKFCEYSLHAKRNFWWWFQLSNLIRAKTSHFHETWRRVKQALLVLNHCVVRSTTHLLLILFDICIEMAQKLPYASHAIFGYVVLLSNIMDIWFQSSIIGCYLKMRIGSQDC